MFITGSALSSHCVVYRNTFYSRVVLALTTASTTIGRSTSMAPDVHKARIAAKNIFDLLDRKSDSSAGDGKCPVSERHDLNKRHCCCRLFVVVVVSVFIL